MNERPNRRELARALSVSWSPALAASVRRRLDGAIALRRRRRRTLILALGVLALGGVSYAFSHLWRAPRLEPTPATALPAAAGPTPPVTVTPLPPPPAPQEPPATGATPASVPPPKPSAAPKRQPATLPPHVVRVSESVDTLLAAADAARLRGRPGEAVAPLTAVINRFPSDPRAAVAAFQLGRVLDDDLHDPAAAAAAFSRALALEPRGPLASDAAARARAALDRATAGMPQP